MLQGWKLRFLKFFLTAISQIKKSLKKCRKDESKDLRISNHNTLSLKKNLKEGGRI